MNKTLTKVAKFQKKELVRRYKIKAKHINTKRLKRYKATPKNLEIKITATKKYITPLMLKNPPSYIVTGYYTAKAKHGGLFMTRTDNQRKTRGKGNPIDFIVGENTLEPKRKQYSRKIKKKRKPTPYYYLQKKTDLDDIALEMINDLHEVAQEIFKKELGR